MFLKKVVHKKKFEILFSKIYEKTVSKSTDGINVFFY